MYWIGNDAAVDLHASTDTRSLAMVRPYGDGFRVVIVGTDTQVPIFLKYETQKEAMEAAIGFVKLLKEN
jgi:hypothetical protein